MRLTKIVDSHNLAAEKSNMSELGKPTCLSRFLRWALCNLFPLWQISPSPKPPGSLPPLPLYDQPPSSPYPSPDKRSSQYFPRSPSANGKGFPGHGSKYIFIQTSTCLPEEQTDLLLAFSLPNNTNKTSCLIPSLRKQLPYRIAGMLTGTKAYSWDLIWQTATRKSLILPVIECSSSKLKGSS